MRKALIAGNWKMNLTQDAARTLAQNISPRAAVDVVLLPSFVHLAAVAQAKQAGIALGAQSLAKEKNGALTGEVSGEMLRDMGCSYVLVGHSERRWVLGEGDALIADKFARAQDAGLIPILCVGESLSEREADLTERVVLAQLAAVLDAHGVQCFRNALISYEPVWAIGTGKTATPEQAQAVHALIRSQIRRHDATIAADLRILYGGSVKGSNAAELIAQPDIDGALVGGAALIADDFNRIIAAA
jgi:triosephosphate isomerase (TIM)